MGLVARDAVRQDTPGCGVPLRRKEVAPVLPDEPRTEKGCRFRAVSQFPDLGEPANEEDCEHAESQCELVNAKAATVDARSEPMPFQAQHGSEARLRTVSAR